MTNTERQREFRKRNPGYYQRLHAKRTAETNAGAALFLQQMRAISAIHATLTQPAPLMLPAPVETIEGLDWIAEINRLREQREVAERIAA